MFSPRLGSHSASGASEETIHHTATTRNGFPIAGHDVVKETLLRCFGCRSTGQEWDKASEQWNRWDEKGKTDEWQREYDGSETCVGTIHFRSHWQRSYLVAAFWIKHNFEFV